MISVVLSTFGFFLHWYIPVRSPLLVICFIIIYRSNSIQIYSLLIRNIDSMFHRVIVITNACFSQTWKIRWRGYRRTREFKAWLSLMLTVSVMLMFLIHRGWATTGNLRSQFLTTVSQCWLVVDSYYTSPKVGCSGVAFVQLVSSGRRTSDHQYECTQVCSDYRKLSDQARQSCYNNNK